MHQLKTERGGQNKNKPVRLATATTIGKRFRSDPRLPTVLRRSPMTGQESGKSEAKGSGKAQGSSKKKSSNDKAQKRPRNRSKTGLTPEAKTNKQVGQADQSSGETGVIREIDDLLGSCEVDEQAGRKLVREAKLKLHGEEVEMITVEEVGRPPLEDDDTDSAADQDDEPEVKRVRSDIEVRVYRWEGSKKSISPEQWSTVYSQLTISLLDPRNASLLAEVQNRDRPITNTLGNLRYGVVGTSTEEGAKGIRMLLHDMRFKKKLQIQAIIHKNTVPDIPTKLNIKVNSTALHEIAETLAGNFARQNGLPGKVLDFRANDIRQGSRFWFLEIFPDEVMLKALEEKKGKNESIKIGLLETRLELIRNKK